MKTSYKFLNHHKYNLSLLVGFVTVLVAFLLDTLRGQDFYFNYSQIILAGVGAIIITISSLLKELSTRSKTVSRKAKLILLFSSTFIGLLLLEAGALYVETHNTAKPDYLAFNRLIDDPVLGQRLPPNALGHDRNGFRNISIPPTVDIVTLGDSQTWGINASKDETWPQVLAQLSGYSVYNMGLNGYGPMEYWSLTEKALSFSPKLIVVGFYFGNDLWDVCKSVYTLEAHAQFRNPEFTEEIYTDYSMREPATSSFRAKFGNDYRESRLSYKYTHLFAITRLLLGSAFDYSPAEVSQVWAQTYPEDGIAVEADNVSTVLTTSYRFWALDLEHPCPAEGLRITKILLEQMQDLLESRNTQLLVVLIPTKEAAYEEIMPVNQLNNESYTNLIEMEKMAKAELISYLENQNISYIDIQPVFSQALATGEPIYMADTDGHPSPLGYRLLAETIEKYVTSLIKAALEY